MTTKVVGFADKAEPIRREKERLADEAEWARLLDGPGAPPAVMVGVCRDVEGGEWKRIDGLKVMKRVLHHRKER